MRPSRQRPKPSARELSRGLAALIVAVVVVVGVPVLLWTAVGWPLPRTLPSPSALREAITRGSISDRVVVNGLAVLTWLAWAQFAACLITETRAALHGRLPRRVPLSAWGAQALAARLVAAALLVAPITTTRAVATAVPVVAQAHTVGIFEPNIDTRAGAPAPPDDQTASEQQVATHVVRARETLWDIAERHYGDGRVWPTIFDSNKDRAQSDGRRLSNPNRIYPGWVLVLPDQIDGTPLHRDSHPPHTDRDEHTDRGAHRQPDRSEGQPPTTARTAPGSATSTPPTATAPTADKEPDAQEHEPFVRLPSGSLVGLTLATAVSAALALAWLHRRRSYIPGPPSPGIHRTDPLVTPLVRRLCYAANARDRRLQDDDGEEIGRAPSVGDVGPGRETAAEPGIGRSMQPPLQGVSVAARDGTEVTVDLAAIGGLGLTGAGADNAARAVIAATLATARAQAAEVVLAGGAVAERLLSDVARFPGLTVPDDLDAALTHLEIELVHRTRLLDVDEAQDIGTFAATHPAEPLPLLLLVTDPPAPALQQRYAAVANLGRRLGIATMVLGHSPGGTTIEVGDDGHVETIEPDAALRELADAWMFTLKRDEVQQVLEVIATANGARTTPQPGQTDDQHSANTQQLPRPAASLAGLAAVSDATARPISVQLFGPMRIGALGDEVRSGLRRKGREALALLLLHPAGMTVDEIVDPLWPDADLVRGTQRYQTVLGNLRSTLKLASGTPTAAVIDWTGTHYRVQADLFDCDVWTFEAALQKAGTATDTSAQIAALERAVECYQGNLLDGHGAVWAEAPRQDFRRRALDALVHLADLRQQTANTDGAIAALERAITLDPYAEDIYRKIMRLQADLGRPDAIWRTLQHLQTKLEEIDAEPNEATIQLAEELLTRIRIDPGPTRPQ